MAGVHEYQPPKSRLHLKKNDDGSFNGALETRHAGEWGIEEIFTGASAEQIMSAIKDFNTRTGLLPAIEGDIPPGLDEK
jgi:hypothetical protein